MEQISKNDRLNTLKILHFWNNSRETIRKYLDSRYVHSEPVARSSYQFYDMAYLVRSLGHVNNAGVSHKYPEIFTGIINPEDKTIHPQKIAFQINETFNLFSKMEKKISKFGTTEVLYLIRNQISEDRESGANSYFHRVIDWISDPETFTKDFALCHSILVDIFGEKGDFKNA